MPITVQLQPMEQYSFIFLICVIIGALLLGVLILAVLLLIWYLRKPKKPVNTRPKNPEPQPVRGRDALKQKYCKEIEKLEKKCQSAKVDNRIAYQQLSILLRRFVHDLTGIKVHNCTLEEIRRLNMPQLASLIEECYAPEFSIDKKGDIYATLALARKVIIEWK